MNRKRTENDAVKINLSEIHTRLATVLKVDPTSIEIIRSKDYYKIQCLDQMTTDALQITIDDLLRKGMVPGKPSRKSDGRYVYQLYLTPMQVSFLTGMQLTKQKSSILHHILHLQESQLLIGDNKTWVQFLDKKGLDSKYAAKYIVSQLNDIILKKSIFKSLKDDLGKGKTLFTGYDNDQVSFIWVEDPVKYQLYRQIAISFFEKTYNYSAPQSEDTVYPRLFAELSPQLTQDMLLSRITNQTTLALLNPASFQPSADGQSYFISIPEKENEFIRKKMLCLAQDSHIKISTQIGPNNTVILDKQNYEIWLKLINTKKTSKSEYSKKEFKINTPFSPYTTDFGEFYIHYPESKRAISIADHLNQNPKTTFFHVDLSLEPPIIFIKKEDYLQWIALKTKDTSVQEIQNPIPKAQSDYIAQLNKMKYSPVIKYQSTLISATWIALKESIPNRSLLDAVKIGLEAKSIFSEENNPKEGKKISGYQKAQFRRALGRLIIEKKPSHDPFVTDDNIEQLHQDTHTIIQYIQGLEYTNEQLYKTIKQFIYPLNRQPNIFYVKENNTIILTSGQFQIDLFNSHLDEIPQDNRETLSILNAQILCALSDLVFYIHYLKVNQDEKAKETQFSAAHAEVAMPVALQSKKLSTRTTIQTEHESATERLLTTRPDVIIGALSMQGSTFIDQSGITGAGNGLHVKGPVTLKKGQIITWFHGQIITPEDVTPDTPETHIISMEGFASRSPHLILCDPDNVMHPGQGSFANHSSKPNVKWKVIYWQKLAVGIALIYDGEPCALQENESYEMVMNYGKSAAQIKHKISGNTDFIPQIQRSRPQKRRASDDPDNVVEENSTEITFQRKRSKSTKKTTDFFSRSSPMQSAKEQSISSEMRKFFSKC